MAVEAAEKLREALAMLRGVLDPHGVGEAVTVRLQHDTGMRLVSTLLKGVPSDELREELTQIDAETRQGREVYELNLYGIRFEWPGRRVDLGDGKSRYI
ncbi:hypothetical protein [Methylobacterium iners]|uniref:Uncharacterized protein n=1 Tax=Methylobacterium iners TaxID=418707 RepID=A0ABQ4S2X6_9HYPH|nr:hypothetical protein [Methylobacterium iners]GJD97434.1 hypothetical protein OCOJLMKI_4665 [Methylobacterium iners]